MSWEIMRTETGPCERGAGPETHTFEMNDWNRTRSLICSPAAPPGTYQVSATGSTTGAGTPLSRSAVVTLTVKPQF